MKRLIFSSPIPSKTLQNPHLPLSPIARFDAGNLGFLPLPRSDSRPLASVFWKHEDPSRRISVHCSKRPGFAIDPPTDRPPAVDPIVESVAGRDSDPLFQKVRFFFAPFVFIPGLVISRGNLQMGWRGIQHFCFYFALDLLLWGFWFWWVLCFEIFVVWDFEMVVSLLVAMDSMVMVVRIEAFILQFCRLESRGCVFHFLLSNHLDPRFEWILESVDFWNEGILHLKFTCLLMKFSWVIQELLEFWKLWYGWFTEVCFFFFFW